MLEFRILGPLEVLREGRPIRLGAAKQRALLAILLLHGNRVVSRERLIDGLWGEQPPPTASTALRVYVSELRKALGPAGSEDEVARPILSAEPGYRIDLQPDQLDLVRFERLTEAAGRALAEGAWSLASEKLQEALKLWRGPALDDFAYEPFAQAAIVRLEELRLVATERRVDADLALGRHVELVAELESLVTEHGLRERLRGQLMLALYRSGRQAEALETYVQGRRILVEELGIEPGTALQELERAILRQDSRLDLVAEGPRPAVPTPAPSIVVVVREQSSLNALTALGAALTRQPPHELIVARLAASDADLGDAADRVHECRKELIAHGIAARAAAFTSSDPGGDIVRLATEQGADLLLVDAPLASLEQKALPADLAKVLAGVACDVALLVARNDQLVGIDLALPVLVPFGGVEHDWAAIELAAWLAASLGVSLNILGAGAVPEAGRRDASRLLARASLIVQQLAGIPAEPVLVEGGEEGMVEAAKRGGLLVVGLSTRWRQEGVGRARLAVARKARPPTLLVRKGLRPSGLAPPEAQTRFTWTFAGE